MAAPSTKHQLLTLIDEINMVTSATLSLLRLFQMLRDGRTEVMVVIVYLTLRRQCKHSGRIIARILAISAMALALAHGGSCLS